MNPWKRWKCPPQSFTGFGGSQNREPIAFCFDPLTTVKRSDHLLFPVVTGVRTKVRPVATGEPGVTRQPWQP